ncbi:hypothetical protein C7M61_001843 [Candidozyma pseudohaemuli]|uniref:Transcriptional regulatory protein RXT2 N-terminal domain-containing protein n=1 Tax=Candidozyma pseudohaemuli TaxID=418784 RepID=A0A2P7YTE6_9ASCO|nr:hypothetical protein C7M61_001843 [[Candida] pseudohaemulonii]PSK39240.1 hypothetical protein C7M61_001843 [[Candida] pseudohaemulonii]
MLDNRSLDVISKFKSAVLTKSHESENTATVTSLNRGRKLRQGAKQQSMKTKIVDYDGSGRLVITNNKFERSFHRRKMRWLEFYGASNVDLDDPEPESAESDGTSDSSDLEDDENDENLFDVMRISEILAPLGHPSEVVTHPAISKTFKLSCLPTLASEFIELIEVEQNTLNHLNKLLRVLNGEDWFYLLEEHLGLPSYDHGLDESETKHDDSTTVQNPEVGVAQEPLDRQETSENKKSATEEKFDEEDPFFALPRSLAKYEDFQKPRFDDSDPEQAEKLEAVQQDLTNYLQLSIQRQQEYIKNLTTIRNGIVKADRYRNDLQRWGKEMSERKN